MEWTPPPLQYRCAKVRISSVSSKESRPALKPKLASLAAPPPQPAHRNIDVQRQTHTCLGRRAGFNFRLLNLVAGRFPTTS
jgi:hypothetical protein